MPEALGHFIPPDYATARALFRKSVERCGHSVSAYPVHGDLTIDIARIGPADARCLVTISGGLHGVEGRFGTGVQLAALEQSWPKTIALLLVHALNPFGYAYWRRMNEDNVDLNRNFLRAGELYSGAPPFFDAADRIVSPKHRPVVDPFITRLWWLKNRIGEPALRKAIAVGQYVSPRGLFYGGKAKSRTHQILDDNVVDWIGAARHVIHLDFHTGLGPWATHKLIINHLPGSERFERWKNRFGDVVESGSVGPTAYHNRGGIDEWMEWKLGDIECDSVCAEFGTYPVLDVLRAVRDENLAWHIKGPESSARDRSAKRLREVFVPADSKWRDRVVSDGLDLVWTAVRALSDS